MIVSASDRIIQFQLTIYQVLVSLNNKYGTTRTAHGKQGHESPQYIVEEGRS